MFEFFEDFSYDFVAKLLIGERLAEYVKEIHWLLWAIIGIYFVYKYLKKKCVGALCEVRIKK